ncbi:MAG: hypothetical protein AAFZ58_04545, partial [Pseudomonadota bacterium]
RDLQRLKAPLFRGIDLAGDALALMAAMLSGVRFRPEQIRLDPGTGAAEAANRLVADEGMAFRDAYRTVAQKFGGDQQ